MDISKNNLRDQKIINISAQLRFIVDNTVSKTYSSVATTIKDIVKLSRGKVVDGSPVFSAEELNTFLSNCEAAHQGVLSDDKKCILEPLKTAPAEILKLNDGSLSRKEKQLFDLASKDKDVVIVGGCFNGIHQGHRDMFASINSRMQERFGKNFVTVYLVEAKKTTQKRESNNPEGHNKKYVSLTNSRVALLQKFKYIDFVVPLPDDFRNYYELLMQLNTSVIFVRKNDKTTIEYCNEHINAAQELFPDKKMTLETYSIPVDFSRHGNCLYRHDSEFPSHNSGELCERKYASRRLFDLDPNEPKEE